MDSSYFTVEQVIGIIQLQLSPPKYLAFDKKTSQLTEMFKFVAHTAPSGSARCELFFQAKPKPIMEPCC